MSSDKNSRRINLSFKMSSPDQSKAYDILNGVSNKTDFITKLILSNSGIEYDTKDKTTKELIREALAELLPTMQIPASFTAAHSVPQVNDTALKMVERKEDSSPAIDETAGEEEIKKNQHPREANADKEDEDKCEDVDVIVPDDFLDSLFDMMTQNQDDTE